MSRPRTTIIALMLALMLALPVAVITPAAAQGTVTPAGTEPVTADQQNKIIRDHGIGAPYGTWETRIEQTRMYLRGQLWLDGTAVAGQGPATVGHPGVNSEGNVVPGNQELWALSTDRPDDCGSGIACDFLDDRNDPFDMDDDEQPTSMAVGLALNSTTAKPDYACREQNVVGTPVDPATGDFEDHTAWFSSEIMRSSVTLYDITVNIPNDGLVTVYFGHTDMNPKIVSNVVFTPPQPGVLYERSTCIGSVDIGGGSSTASLDLGLDGYTIPANHTLNVIVEGVPEAQVHVDSAANPAFIDIMSDSGRVNLWTENHRDEATIHFPHPVGAATEERRVEFNALVADPFGTRDCSDQGAPAPEHDPNEPADECPGDAFDQNNVRFRVRDVTPEHRTAVDPSWDRPWQYNEYVPLDQGLGLKNDPQRDDFLVRCCGTVIEPIVYNPTGAATNYGVVLMQYTFVYGEDFPPGLYQIEFHEAGQRWKVFHEIDIGHLGWSFEFAPGEAEISSDGKVARHTVRSNEATEYILRATNQGARAETFSVSIPAPETPSLGVTVTPHTQLVQPGDHADFVVRVTPPSHGVAAGDKKVVRAQGVGLQAGTVDTLVMETTYVGYDSFEPGELPADLQAAGPFGVDIESTRKIVETRPERVESFGVVMRNLGTVGDDFVITPEGVPKGWTVHIQPAYLHVLAASREEFLVQVYAPAEAIPPADPTSECAGSDPHPGCDWTLYLRAKRIADAAIQDVEEIPIHIFLVDAFDTTPLKSTINMRDVADNRYDLPQGQSGTGIHRVSQDPSHADVQFDDAALFRLKVENKGDREDTFPLTVSWDPQTGKDEWGCERNSAGTAAPRSGDGVPDGWRFRMLDHPGIDIHDRVTSFVPDFPAAPQTGGAAGYTSSATGTEETGFSGEFTLGEITLPARTSDYVWIELHWVNIPDDDEMFVRGLGNNPVVDDLAWSRVSATCSDEHNALPVGSYSGATEMHFRDESIATEAELRVTTRSTNDPALRDVERLRVEMTEPTAPVSQTGMAPGATHGVMVEAGLDVVQPGVVHKPNRTHHTPAFYQVHVVNLGNEHDTMTVRVDPGKNGWEHKIADYRVVPSYITTEPVGFDHGDGHTGNVGKKRDPDAVPTPQNAHIRPNVTSDPSVGCRILPDEIIALELTCQGMGIHDEVLVTVMTKPPFDARIGERDFLPVTATSRADAANIYTDTIVLETRVQGDYFFELENLAGERKTYPGQVIAFPFTIHNEGTQRDEYDIVIQEAPQLDGLLSLEHSWKPRLCGAHRVSVPGDYDYHSCLLVTVPLDWPAGDDRERVEESFRLRVKSTKGPVGNQQTGLLDFVAVVEQNPGYLVESQEVTVRPGDDATFNIETTYLRDETGKLVGEQYGSVEYSIDLETVPEGYNYTCTPESLQGANPTCKEAAPERDVRFFTSTGEAIGDMNLQAPEKQIGTSRIVSRVQVVPDNEPEFMSWHDAITNAATVYGVNIDVKQLRDQRLATCRDLVDPDGVIDAMDKCLNNKGRFTDLALQAGAVEPSLVIKPGKGHDLRIDLLIENPGLSPETVKIRNSPLPEGWTISQSDATGRFFEFQGQVCPPDSRYASDTNAVCLEPLSFADPQLGFGDDDVMRLNVTVSTEKFLDAGDQLTMLFFAEVVQDPTVKAQIAVPIVVGTFEHGITANDEPVKAAPQDVVVFTSTVKNTGNVPDTLELTVLPPPKYASFFVSEFLGGRCQQTSFNAEAGQGARCNISLLPGEKADVQFSIEVPETVAPNAYVPIVVESRSIGAGTANIVKDTAEFAVEVLEYVWMDVDQDGFREFAIDRDGDRSNGFEQFRENREQGGVQTRWLSPQVLLEYLDDEQLKQRLKVDLATKEESYRYFVDGNGDGFRDHLLDRDGDGLPDVYFDPFYRYVYEIGITTDVTFDGVREFFLDVNQDCRLDSFLDITRGTNVDTGKFHALVQVHTDDDDFVDYVIDLDGDGNLDPNEVVIKGREQIACDRFNGLTQIGQIILKVDMNGDGKLDTVIDLDGDGDPDQFIPNGQKNAIAIHLEDVTKDGVNDWTYASTGKGDPDSFYDPVHNRSGFIDAESQFVKDLKTYWWVAALFVFVLLLFAVLVAVTRR